MGRSDFLYSSVGGGIPSVLEHWNETLDRAARSGDVEVVVLLHDDLRILDPAFEEKVRAAFEAPHAPGVLGAIGSTGAPTERWWESRDVAGVIAEPRGRLAGRRGVGEVDRLDDAIVVVRGDLVRDGLRLPPGATLLQAVAGLCDRVRDLGHRVEVVPVDVRHEGHTGHPSAGDTFEAAPVPGAMSNSNVTPPRGAMTIVAPDAALNVHAHAFDEVLECLDGGLRRLGYETRTVLTPEGVSGPAIVVAPHLQRLDVLRRMGAETIFYNWEPLGAGGNGITSDALMRFLAQRRVWDYARKNVPLWRHLGNSDPVHVPLGYDPALEHLAPSEQRSIDVLFYGSITPRREKLLKELAARGVRLHVVFGAYGQERDDLVRRSRLVLCLHSYESSILELARLSYLWANGVPVACEIGPQTEDALAMAGHCHSAPADGIVDLVVDLLNDRERVEVGAVTARARLRDRADAAALLRVALEDPAIVA